MATGRFLFARSPWLAAKNPQPDAVIVCQTGDANEAIKEVVNDFVSELSSSELDGVRTYWKINRGVPADLDRKLLPICGQAFGRRLERDEIRLARAEFQRAVSAILQSRMTPA